MLKYYNITDSKLFSIKLDNVTDLEEGEATGSLYIGKHEEFSSKNTKTCPLIKGSNGFWAFQIDGIGLKKSNKEIKSSKRNCTVILKTTTDALILPYEYLSDIEKNLSDINCNTFKEEEYYGIRCPKENNDTLPDFRLNINGTFLTIPAKYAFELSRVNYYSNIYYWITIFICLSYSF